CENPRYRDFLLPPANRAIAYGSQQSSLPLKRGGSPLLIRSGQGGDPPRSDRTMQVSVIVVSQKRASGLPRRNCGAAKAGGGRISENDAATTPNPQSPTLNFTPN